MRVGNTWINVPANPAQAMRLNNARLWAEAEAETLRELDRDWRPTQNLLDPSNVESHIRAYEAEARAARDRYADILRDAIPGTNPTWGVNRLRKELNQQGYLFKEATDSPGWLYEKPQTGEQIRIMERPTRTWRTDSPQKHYNDYYYRYRPSRNAPYGSHISIPNKP